MGLLLILVVLYPFVATWIVWMIVRPAVRYRFATLFAGLTLVMVASWFAGRADEVLWEGIVSAVLVAGLTALLTEIAHRSRRLRECSAQGDQAA